MIHFQKTTGCDIWKLFILDFNSKLKICKLSPAAPATDAFSAMTLVTGFMRALSAVIGRLSGLRGEAISTMTTEFCAPVSRTQINLSDSIVTLRKEMNCWLIPKFGSCKHQSTGRKIKHSTSSNMPCKSCFVLTGGESSQVPGYRQAAKFPVLSRRQWANP